VRFVDQMSTERPVLLFRNKRVRRAVASRPRILRRHAELSASALTSSSGVTLGCWTWATVMDPNLLGEGMEQGGLAHP